MASMIPFVCCILLSTFLSVASQDDPDCTNKNDHCDGWAAGGQCEKNPIYMVANCRLACGKCRTDTESSSDSCRNNNIDEVCEFWASRCECEKNPGYMYGNCRRACGGCDTNSESQTNSSTCRNKHIDGVCKFWAGAGECEKNPGYMNANCRQACGKCDDDSLSETSAGNQTSPCAPVIQATTTSPAPLQAPRLTPSGSALARVGVTSLTLTCQTTSEGSITYTFLQNGTQVQSSESNMYSVSSLDFTDSGTYTCVASSGDEKSSSPDSYVLTVVDVTLGLTPSGACANEGSDLPSILTCAATGDGPFTYTFFQDGIEVQRSESTNYTMSIPQASDGGTYTCTVASDDGEVTSSPFTLYVIFDRPGSTWDQHDFTVRPAVTGMDQMYGVYCHAKILSYIHEDSFSDFNTSQSKCQQGGPGARMKEFKYSYYVMSRVQDYLGWLGDIDNVYIGAYFDVSTEEWRLSSSVK